MEKATQNEKYSLYPIFVDLHNRRIVVIGGGDVAERKVKTLLAHGAKVTVIAPEATEEINELASSGAIELERRPYEPGDLAGAAIAFSACGIPEVDDDVLAEAHERNCLVNVVDVRDKCDFYVPSLVERGPLSIAVSTQGTSPSTARDLRKRFEREFDTSWGAYLNLMGGFRALVQERISGPASARRPYYDAASLADWRDRLAKGESLTAEEAFEEVRETLGGEDR